MSNKAILLAMASLLLGGLLFVGLVLSSKNKEAVDTSLVRPTTEGELVSQLLNIARAREEGARAVRERGVVLRPIRDYAAVMEGREAERVSKITTWSNNDEGGGLNMKVDWWNLPESELAATYVHFEQEQNQYLRQLLGDGRLFKDEASRDLVKQWADTVLADEAQLQELSGLLPAI